MYLRLIPLFSISTLSLTPCHCHHLHVMQITLTVPTLLSPFFLVLFSTVGVKFLIQQFSNFLVSGNLYVLKICRGPKEYHLCGIDIDIGVDIDIDI